ncbi:hypothetical protein BYT27DRAFT_7301243, partial [Phlegmacium glaucopus]
TMSLSDFLNSTVPKLGDEGENWGIFLVRFKDAVQAKASGVTSMDHVSPLHCLLIR